MNYRIATLGAAIGFLLLTLSTRVAGEIEGKVIVCPHQWRITEERDHGKVLLAWEVTNLHERYIRFRKRDLGFVQIFDSRGNKIKPLRLGVDATRKFQESDYPLIGPNETIYLPFVTSFKRGPNGTYSLKIRSNSDGDEGWIYENLKKGNYSLVITYSSAPLHQNNNTAWDLEMGYFKEKLLGPFWSGDLTSKEVKFTIGDQS